MDCSELLRLQTANAMACTRLNIAVGPTGPQGPYGNPNNKVFTLYLDYSSGTALSRIYIPPGFSTHPSLSSGGIFTVDIPGVLSFTGITNITINNTTYDFPIAIGATGFVGATAATANWQPTAAGNLGGANITWNLTAYNMLVLKNVTPTRINGGNTTIKPAVGTILSENGGWLATITLFYL